MPTITATNSGSGLDVRNLVDQLVAAEGTPVSSRLDQKEVKVQEGLTAMGTFKGALLDFQSSLAPLRKTDAFKAISATSSDEEIFTVSTTDNAAIGSYELEISQLAQSQKLKSAAYGSEIEHIGSGTITIEFGEVNRASNTFDLNTSLPSTKIEIEEGNGSLRDIQLAINAADLGAKASIINDGTGYRLILNAEKTGTENSLRISVDDHDKENRDLLGLSFLAYNPVATADEGSGIAAGKNLEIITDAKNAVFSIDGISISNATNTVSDNIPGVTLELNKTTKEGFESFNIEKDISGVKQSIESFVANYNELIGIANSLTGYNAETQQAGPLSGDASIRGIVNQTRRLLSSSFNDINKHLTSLSAIGIDSNLDGALRLDNVKLERSLTDYPDEIAHLFSAAVSSSDPRLKVVSDKVPAVNGIYDMSIEDLPRSGFYIGETLSSFPDEITGFARTFSMIIDGTTTSELNMQPQKFASGKEFAAALEGVINRDVHLQREGKSVTVDYINNTLKITSNSVGSQSNVAVKSMSRYLYFLAGMPMGQGQAGTDLTANIGSATITGVGNKLNLEGDLSGIVLEVSGTNTGKRGNLTVTNGIASTLDNLMESFLENDGLVDARIDGFNANIKSINKQRDDLVRKLEVSEQRYLKQFSNLDAMLGKMRSTSSFLSEKLSALPGAAGNK